MISIHLTIIYLDFSFLFHLKLFLELLNKILHGTSDRYMTLISMSFDFIKNDALYVSAGHNPPYYYNKTSLLDSLNALTVSPGNALGYGLDSAYKTNTMKFNSGDVFFVYTDGLFECRNTKMRAFGINKVRKILSANRSKSIEDLTTILKNELFTFKEGTPFQDDLSFIFIEIK